MNDPMSNLKGLQPEVKTKLASEGIRTTTQLLEHTRTQKQCAELAHEVGTTLFAIKELANRADLMRLHGVGGNFSNRLVEVGVTSCRELQHCIPEKLHTQLEKISTDKTDWASRTHACSDDTVDYRSKGAGRREIY